MQKRALERNLGDHARAPSLAIQFLHLALTSILEDNDFSEDPKQERKAN